VILADPECPFEPRSRKTGLDRSADNHYPTSPTAAIAARDVASIAADDAVLFLWATIPMLPDALLVMRRWGFEYRSHFAWVKDAIGTGFWIREKHELLLIGTRGRPVAPAPGQQWESVFHSPRGGRHSEKAEEVLEMIEALFPNVPKVELNRRGPPRPGWSAWGNGVGVEV
jgi:N6-adenosine-specific RNA methylase IME4